MKFYYRIAKKPNRIHLFNDFVEILIQENDDKTLSYCYKKRGKGHRWQYMVLDDITFNKMKMMIVKNPNYETFIDKKGKTQK